MNTQVEQLQEIITGQLRKTVDLRNTVRDKEIEKHDQLKAIALGIIDTLDSFDRAEEVLAEKGLNETPDGSKVMKRYQSVQKKLITLLQRHGISRLEYPEGKLIVGFTKVIDTEPDATKQNDEIISIVRHGYHRGKELIREAELIVVKN